MIGLTSLFDIARSALTTSQQALAVTGHNVANVNTPGYSRQEAVLTERPPLNGQPGMAGTGVMATSIRRYTDQFINRQLTTVQQNLGRLSVSREELFRLQNLFGDSNNQGIAARMNDFFSWFARCVYQSSRAGGSFGPVGKRQAVDVECESGFFGSGSGASIAELSGPADSDGNQQPVEPDR